MSKPLVQSRRLLCSGFDAAMFADVLVFSLYSDISTSERNYFWTIKSILEWSYLISLESEQSRCLFRNSQTPMCFNIPYNLQTKDQRFIFLPPKSRSRSTTSNDLPLQVSPPACKTNQYCNAGSSDRNGVGHF